MMQTRIQHLSLRQSSATDNIVAQRLWVERLLHAADMRPPGMSSGEVLVIREIRGLPPLSGITVPSSVWRNALLECITDLRHQAEYPALRPVTKSANSVLFSDPADMLILFTEHTVTGQTHQHWYWSKVVPDIGQQPPMISLVALWVRNIQWLPVTLNKLPSEVVMKTLEQLTADQILQILDHLNEAYRLDSRITSLQKDKQSEPSDHIIVPSIQEPTDKTVPIWQQWLPPGINIRLSREATCLYGLCLTLARLPSVARMAQFQQRIEQWLYTVDQADKFAAKDTSSVTTAPEVMEDAAVHFDIQTGRQFTNLAGVFFLVNALKFAGFPEAMDQEILSKYTGWAFIDSIARTLLKDTIEGFSSDFIWEILASLDNRDASETWQPGDRLTELVHEFILYLESTFDATDTIFPAKDLIIKPGQVLVTKTHIDVYMALTDADIRLRRLGLDSDPGWVPELGYIIYFHFE